MALSGDLRIAEVRLGFQEHAYRSPMKFGGRVVERATLLDAEVRVRTRAGREAAAVARELTLAEPVRGSFRGWGTP